ncbi:histidinol-phosphatase [Snodgrassella communis]|uniref:histidinol-phosphatase n=1 Tax=Snodgrassella communis TaxID=2946699 RepID=UPI00286D50B8|nr:HAD family hydrolase [Snodgrassella communis]WMY91414.1 HAD-IB family hydrolase [Snodgrassella communis]
MNLAIFDLDNTLINCDSDNEWPKYLLQKGLVDKSFVDMKNDKFYQDYLNGCLDIDEFLQFQLAPLACFSRAELDEMHTEYMHDFIVPHISTMAKMLVQGHHDAGDEMLLLSATNEFIIAPIAKTFGIQNIIGVQLETDAAGNYTGRYIGTPSFKEGKVTRLQQWLAQRGQRLSDFDKVYFYSDSHNDLPLLKEVTDPVAVNPDEKLAQYARRHGWPILNFM